MKNRQTTKVLLATTALLLSSAANACSVIPQNASFSLDDFTSKVTNTIELEETLSLRVSGECSGSLIISFKPREVITLEEEPTIFLASAGKALFNSIVGGLNNASVELPEGESFVSIPLRLVADVSLAKHHLDIARSIPMSFQIIDDSGVLTDMSQASITLVEGADPTYFASTPSQIGSSDQQMVSLLDVSKTEIFGRTTINVMPKI